MSSLSTFGKYIYSPSTEIAADAPLSARKMTDLANNLQHLVDCHGQYRVHYAAPTSGGLLIGNTAIERIFSATIPWSYMNQSGKPFSPYCKITGQATEGNSLFVQAVFGLAGNHLEDYLYSPIFWTSSTITATTDTTLVDGIVDISENDTMRLLSAFNTTRNVTDLDTDGSEVAYLPVKMTEIRFTVWALGHGYINYIQLREHCTE